MPLKTLLYPQWDFNVALMLSLLSLRALTEPDSSLFLICGFQTAQTVLVVVVVFCLSWLPHHVVHLWVEFGTFPLNQASFVLRVAAHCLAYSNSSVNPVIYAFLSENFRKAYKQVFKCQIGSSDSPLNDIKEMRSKVDTPPSTNCTEVWLTRCGCWQENELWWLSHWNSM